MTVEEVDLKKHEGVTNKQKQFVFLQETLRLNHNLSQPQTAPNPPDSCLLACDTALVPFHTSDYAELDDDI